MKVKELVAFEGGSARITLESEHPAELAIIRLLSGCEATCEAKAPDVHPEQKVVPGTPMPDPELRINITVKKNRF